MKRKFKQWWSLIQPLSTKRTITSHLNWTHWTKIKTTTWCWKSRSWLRRCKKCCRIKAVSEISTLPFDILRLSFFRDICNIYIKCLISVKQQYGSAINIHLKIINILHLQYIIYYSHTNMFETTYIYIVI